MYTPLFRKKENAVPILSKAEIDQIAENLVSDFCPQAMIEPMELDIDRFITRYLGMTLDYQSLSHCGLYLGMTVFSDTSRVPVFDHSAFQAKFISAKAGTVIIDNSLLVDTQEHRYRFTAGHEASHKILHSEYFTTQSPSEFGTMVQCRSDNMQAMRCNYRRTDAEWMEWQADHLSSAILMPKSMVIKAAKRAERRSCSVNAALEAVQDVFNVSYEAANYRLQDLGLIQKRQRNYR